MVRENSGVVDYRKSIFLVLSLRGGILKGLHIFELAVAPKGTFFQVSIIGQEGSLFAWGGIIVRTLQEGGDLLCALVITPKKMLSG